MGKETEKKFLVKRNTYRQLGKPIAIRQGFLSVNKDRVVRIRLAGQKAFITVKGRTQGETRPEYEYEIPPADAREMLDTLCLQPLIEKNRYRIQYKGFTWEVDEFFGDNEGLIVAEVELECEGQVFLKPDWVGREVTGEARYYNAALIGKPYSSWPDRLVETP